MGPKCGKKTSLVGTDQTVVSLCPVNNFAIMCAWLELLDYVIMSCVSDKELFYINSVY